MLLTLPLLLLLVLSFFLIATLYSSVGFGGGSSYLALLALVLSSFFVVRSTALLCNLVVVSAAAYQYWKNDHLQIKKFLPFILSGVPFAFVGARYKLSEQVFFGMLGVALIVSALALIIQAVNLKRQDNVPFQYPFYVHYVLGAAIGFLSGLVGIGGGVFLAPILLYLNWDAPVKVAALASFFILVNSIAGIVGLVSTGTFKIHLTQTLCLLLAVFLGGQLGVRISISKLTGKGIKIVTALLVLLVGLRLLVINMF